MMASSTWQIAQTLMRGVSSGSTLFVNTFFLDFLDCYNHAPTIAYEGVLISNRSDLFYN